MLLVCAIAIGALVSAGLYLMLRRNVVKILFGLALLGHAANLLIFVLGGLVRGRAPIVPVGSVSSPAGAADPVPQALVLTAIVIGFAVIAFAAVLLSRAQNVLGTGDPDEMRESDQ
jgi:multicomponent Na+:H+ antiporter subunit C